MPGAMKPMPALSRVLLQTVLDLLIFELHFGRHRGAGLGERPFEMLHRHRHRLDRAAQREHAGAADQILEVGAGEALGPLGHRVEVDVGGQRHIFGMDGKDVAAAGRVGDGDIDQFVEAAGAEQGRIDQVRPVGGADHDDGLQFLEPVHLGEDGVDHTLRDLRLAEAAAARRDEAVELVDEDHGRRDLAGAGEQTGDLLLALAIPFGEKVGRFGGDEIGFRLPSGRLGEQGLAGAGRAVEQEALGRPYAEPAEAVGMLQGQLDALAKPLARRVDSADIVPAHIGRLNHHLAHRRGLDPLQRLLEILAGDRERVEHLGRESSLPRG